MKKIIYTCFIAVFTISCAEDSPWLTKNDLEGRAFYTNGSVAVFEKDSLRIYLDGQSAGSFGWATDDTLVTKNLANGIEASAYIDSNYNLTTCCAKRNGVQLEIDIFPSMRLVELKPAPEEYPTEEYPKFWWDEFMTGQPWAMYRYIKRYNEPYGINHATERENFFSNESRENFASLPDGFMVFDNDTAEQHYQYRTGTALLPNITEDKNMIYWPGGNYFEFKILDGEKEFAANMYKYIREEGHFIVSLYSFETRRLTYWWFEPMTLDNALPALPHD